MHRYILPYRICFRNSSELYYLFELTYPKFSRNVEISEPRVYGI